MGLAGDDIKVWIRDALERLYDGKPAFEAGNVPITRDHVISRLRAFRAITGGPCSLSLTESNRIRALWISVSASTSS